MNIKCRKSCKYRKLFTLQSGSSSYICTTSRYEAPQCHFQDKDTDPPEGVLRPSSSLRGLRGKQGDLPLPKQPKPYMSRPN